jgi:DegV family protein with EDD domain
MTPAMPGRVAIVTDSTASLPCPGPGADGGTGSWSVVPLTVTIDGVQGLEGVDVQPSFVAAALHDHRRVTTSMPPPALFDEAFERARRQGAEAVVTVHLSSALSGTCGAARAAAARAPLPVHVVDSHTVAMGLGFAVQAAARAAADGADAREVVRVAERTAAATRTHFCLDGLEQLRRGGRLSATSTALGTALAFKPLLRVAEGRLVLTDKVRTASRALARLEELVVADAAVAESDSPAIELAVHHLGMPERAAALLARLRDRVPYLGNTFVSEVSAVIAAHTGPGLLGVVVRRLRPEDHPA